MPSVVASEQGAHEASGLHFTYDKSQAPDLNQGDLIKRTNDVVGMLEQVHPHYAKTAGYDYFLILTQSCDLVRRGGNICKSNYITLAAVRPLAKVLEREMLKNCTEVEARIKFSSTKVHQKLSQFLQRLLNNNERDYFYIHREPKVDLKGDYCAFLPLSISVKADLHYEKLLAGRLLQLKESFQHKLGYWAGNMYSRIGTPDWDDNYPRGVLASQVNELLERHSVWIEHDIHAEVVKQLKEIEAKEKRPTHLQDLNTVKDSIMSGREKNRQQFLDAFSRSLKDLNLEGEMLSRVVGRLSNLPHFRSIKFK